MTQLRPEIATSSRRLRVYHLRRKGGREEIDIVVELPGVELIALEIKARQARRLEVPGICAGCATAFRTGSSLVPCCTQDRTSATSATKILELILSTTWDRIGFLRRIRTQRLVSSTSLTNSPPLGRWTPGSADGRIVVEAFPKRSNRSTSATLDAVRTDKDVLLGDEKREPGRFRLSISKDIGVARKTSKSAVGFIDSVVGQITSFYGTVLEDLTPWTPPAPRITRQQPDVDPEPTHTPEDGWTA